MKTALWFFKKGGNTDYGKTKPIHPFAFNCYALHNNSVIFHTDTGSHMAKVKGRNISFFIQLLKSDYIVNDVTISKVNYGIPLCLRTKASIMASRIEAKFVNKATQVVMINAETGEQYDPFEYKIATAIHHTNN